MGSGKGKLRCIGSFDGFVPFFPVDQPAAAAAIAFQRRYPLLAFPTHAIRNSLPLQGKASRVIIQRFKISRFGDISL